MNRIWSCNYCCHSKTDMLVSSAMLRLCPISISLLPSEGGCIVVPLLQRKIQKSSEFLLETWILSTKLLSKHFHTRKQKIWSKWCSTVAYQWQTLFNFFKDFDFIYLVNYFIYYVSFIFLYIIISSFFIIKIELTQNIFCWYFDGCFMVK